MNIKSIKTGRDFQDTLERLEIIFDAKLDTPEGDELKTLEQLIDNYEKTYFPINS